jgi:hypothetical protein
VRETIDRVFVLFNERTERFYRRSGTSSPSVWSTQQGAHNAKNSFYTRRDPDWAVKELKVTA